MNREYAPVADRRDAKGRWLPGAIPPGGDAPKLVGDVRARAIELLEAGYSIRATAEQVGCDDAVILRAAARDEEIYHAIQRGIRLRRLAESEAVGRVATIVRRRLEDEAATAPAHAVRSLATAAAILVDKERDLASLGGSTVGVRLQVADDVFSLEVAAKAP